MARGSPFPPEPGQRLTHQPKFTLFSSEDGAVEGRWRRNAAASLQARI
jgi:hypothetical protein